MTLLTSPQLIKAESRLASLLDRTFSKASNVRTLDYAKELPRNARRWFRSATFSKQLDLLITEIIKQSILYADGQMKILTAAKLEESKILTEEAVKMSGNLSADVAESIVRMLKDDAIYYQHPNALAKRIQDLWNGERYRAVRFARTFTADVATASAVHRYRQYGVRYMEFDAKIDDRTSDQCRCLDGVQFDLERGSIDKYRPPLHHHCFTFDTNILTLHGSKCIGDIEIGDMVLTHLRRPMRVTDKMSNFPDELLEISFDDRMLKTTSNHPILVYKNNMCQWIPAGELKEGDEVVMYE